MLNRFFNKKPTAEEGNRGPPGNRRYSNPTSSTDGSAAGASGVAMNTELPAQGGGFFNLPPVTKAGTAAPTSYSMQQQLPSQAAPVGPAALMANIPPSHQYSSHSMQYIPSPAPTQQAYPVPSPSAHQSFYSGSPAPTTDMRGGGDLFGGMSIRSNTQQPSLAVAAPPTLPSGPSLFSGLEVSSMATNPDFSIQSQPSSYPVNQMATVKGSLPVEEYDVPPAFNRAGNISKKKKRAAFRPGFGRGTSDEYTSAVQDGQVAENDMKQDYEPNPSSSEVSVLSGLTVHTSGDAPLSTPVVASSGSILSGLTVRMPATSLTEISPEKSGASVGSGLLAGLNVRTTTGPQVTKPPVKAPSPDSRFNAPGPKVEQSKPLTPDDILSRTIKDFQTSASAFQRDVEVLAADENELIDRRQMLEQQLNGYMNDLHSVEEMQERASEAEDFEQAEALNSKLKNIKHIITLTETDLRKLETDIAALIRTKERAFGQQVTQTRGTLGELQKFKDEQERQRKQTVEVYTKKSADAEERFTYESERINSEREHVDTNLSRIQEERNHINTSIKETCKEEIQLKEEYVCEKRGLDEEVERLRSELRIKEKEIAQYQQKIDEIDGQIMEVTKTFQKQLQRLDAREATLENKKGEINSELIKLENEKEKSAQKKAEFEGTLQQIDRRIEAVDQELQTATQLTKSLEARDERRKSVDSRRKAQTLRLSQLKESAIQAEQKYKSMLKQQKDLHVRKLEYQTIISSASSRLPCLEHEKKAAAAQRDFKEAGRLSKEIKQLQADQEQAEASLSEVSEQLSSFERTLKERLSVQTEKETELQAAQKEFDLKTLRELWDASTELKRAIKKIMHHNKNDQEGGYSSHHGGPDFQEAAIMLLRAELDACAIEIEVLQKKHGVEAPEEDDSSSDREVDEPVLIRQKSYEEIAKEIEEDSSDDISSKIINLEKQISEATMNDDYELADQLDKEIRIIRETLATKSTKIDVAVVESPQKGRSRVEKPSSSWVPELAICEPAKMVRPSYVVAREIEQIEKSIVEIEEEIAFHLEEEDYDQAAILDETLSIDKKKLEVLKTELDQSILQRDDEAMLKGVSPPNEPSFDQTDAKADDSGSLEQGTMGSNTSPTKLFEGLSNSLARTGVLNDDGDEKGSLEVMGEEKDETQNIDEDTEEKSADTINDSDIIGGLSDSLPSSRFEESHDVHCDDNDKLGVIGGHPFVAKSEEEACSFQMIDDDHVTDSSINIIEESTFGANAPHGNMFAGLSIAQNMSTASINTVGSEDVAKGRVTDSMAETDIASSVLVSPSSTSEEISPQNDSDEIESTSAFGASNVLFAGMKLSSSSKISLSDNGFVGQHSFSPSSAVEDNASSVNDVLRVNASSPASTSDLFSGMSTSVDTISAAEKETE